MLACLTCVRVWCRPVVGWDQACVEGVVSLDDVVTVPERAVGIKGTSAGLKHGDTLTVGG